MKRPAWIPVGLGAVAIVALIALFLGIIFGANALLAWGAQYVLAAFGVHVSFWVCFVAMLVIGSVFGRIGSSSSK